MTHHEEKKKKLKRRKQRSSLSNSVTREAARRRDCWTLASEIGCIFLSFSPNIKALLNCLYCSPEGIIKINCKNISC